MIDGVKNDCPHVCTIPIKRPSASHTVVGGVTTVVRQELS